MVELAPGSVIAGRFVLERKLGEGGMGVVWAARHSVTRKAVALKMLKADMAGDEVARQRFVREARAASTVQHPNIIEIRDVIELEDGAPAIVMDLLEGESLGALLEREPKLPIEHLAPIMLQVVSAVGTAHAAGIVHRDLKPDNIFLVPHGGGVSVRVLDFGIAKVIPAIGEAPVSGGLTNTGTLLGTPYYMSPEQIFGERNIGPPADIWAIGVILYECLSGGRPTEAGNVGQILRIIANDEIRSLGVVAPDVPPDVIDLVDRMLRRNPSQRPYSLVGAYDVLRRYAAVPAAPAFAEPSSQESISSADPMSSGQSRAILASDPNVHPTAATFASTTGSTTGDPLAGMRVSRSARRALPLLIVGLVLASVGAFVVSGRRSPPNEASAASLAASTPSTQPAAVSLSPMSTLSAPPRATLDPPAQSAPVAATTVAPAATRPRPPPARTASAATAAPRVPAPPADTTPHPSPYDHL